MPQRTFSTLSSGPLSVPTSPQKEARPAESPLEDALALTVLSDSASEEDRPNEIDIDPVGQSTVEGASSNTQTPCAQIAVEDAVTTGPVTFDASEWSRTLCGLFDEKLAKILDRIDDLEREKSFSPADREPAAPIQEEPTPNPEWLESLRLESKAREKELNGEIDRLLERVRSLEDELSAQHEASGLAGYKEQVGSLQQELTKLRCENETLRYQYDELSKRKVAEQPATEVVGKTPDHDSWDWEAKKRAWIEQLEDDNESGNRDARKVLKVETLLKETSVALAQKDSEIEELRNLLAEQTVAKQGIAIGAAAIAAQVDADDLVREERLRLSRMKEEWEQKQRQAEIEMSLERAKLARERLDLQEKISNIEAMQIYAPTTDTVHTTAGADTKPGGRWLQRLGLREG